MEPSVVLRDGKTMPRVGLGCWELRGAAAADNVAMAVAAGYRLLDTAAYYGNEADIGAGIAGCGAPRAELFVTSKVWPEEMVSRARVRRSCLESLERLKLSYLDLFLLHWPIGDVPAAWEELLRLREEGLVRSVGVSNFMPAHLDALLKTTDELPAVNQFECNPRHQQRAALERTRSLGICPQAWGPLGKGRALSDPVIAALSERYGVTPAQIVLRWELQLGFCVIPKSASEARLRENMQLFDFALSPDDMAAMALLDTGRTDRYYPSEFDPARFAAAPEGGIHRS